MTVTVKIPAASGRQAFTIYAPYLENLNYYLKTPITAADLPAATNKQVTVKAHQRRQYPGDTALSNVPASSREFLVDPARRSGNGLPGRSFSLVGDEGLPGEERRTFTLKGRLVDLHAWLGTNANMQVKLISNRGTKYTIGAAGTP